jgi:hypothetical protein
MFNFFNIFTTINSLHYSFMKRSFKAYLVDLKHVLLVALLVISFLICLFTFTESTCAKIVDESSINSCTTIVYQFEVNHKFKQGSMDTGILKKEISFKAMQKMKCVQIKYSKLVPNINWISDPRIVE